MSPDGGRAPAAPAGTVYVSITGLVLHSPLHWPRFALHAAAAMRQARSAPGNRYAAARIIGDVLYTLSAGDSRALMLDYLRSGAHRSAVRAFRKTGHGKTYGFETVSPTGWAEIPALYRGHATPV